MRALYLTRNEAENLTDALMLINTREARELDEEIRALFGMSSMAEELRFRGVTYDEIRRDFAKTVLYR